MTNAQEKGSGSKVKSLFPILTWLSNYNWKDIRFDVIAGIVVAGLIIPESMGIAGVAGVEPQHGLYAILIALFLYAIFGSGRRSVVSVPSAMALLTASAIATLALTAYEDVLAAVVTITLLTGLILLIMAVLRLGLLANFISYPVMKGFLFGLALTIIIGQVPKLLGVESPNFSKISSSQRRISINQPLSSGITSNFLSLTPLMSCGIIKFLYYIFS
jgi:SulP family sulfate permease